MDELERDLRSIDPATRPVFAHTRPLDLHVANVRGASVPSGESYPGFREAYAARIHQIDACFGRFVVFLKESQLYDSSIIVVMSDHGDSLGDELRWGHAYTLFPEVLKIPLMIHLPSSLREHLAADLARVSFTVDVTPTLYKLLGYEPERLGPLFGSSLFEDPGRDLSWRRREAYVIASSYGAVYGVLSHNGRKLYIADAINARDYAYDLTGHALGVRSGMTDADRDLNRQLIREQVGALAASYHFVP
jgi:arylsulfatase A-like enzyme